MPRIRTFLAAVATAFVFATPATTQLPPLAIVEQPAGAPIAIDGPSLSVLTYNVEGLPFPVRFGRSGAAQRIAARLRGLRAEGAQPHVVVLQEAFSGKAGEIAAQAGYRYVARGPDRDLASSLVETDQDRAFAGKASFFKGERSGKWVDSGVAILSDYPIVDVQRAAFPAFACAGYDCLANKGVVMATIQVPGAASPVAVIATHLNSKAASGVAKARFNYAFTRQIDTIDAFLRAHLPADMPYVLAGDTNIGKSAARLAVFDAMLARLPHVGSGERVRTALGTCLDPSTACPVPAGRDAEASFRRAKDLQVYAAGDRVTLRPVAISVPFGHEHDGSMLSDHIGYVATYKLGGAQPLPRRA